MAAAECADDQGCRDLDEFFDSMKQCFDEVDKELNDEFNSIPLDYLESTLEDHFQVVHAIAIAIQNNVWVNSKSDHPPPGQTPGHLTFLKMPDQIPLYMGRFLGQMPHWLGLKSHRVGFFFFFFFFFLYSLALFT